MNDNAILEENHASSNSHDFKELVERQSEVVKTLVSPELVHKDQLPSTKDKQIARECTGSFSENLVTDQSETNKESTIQMPSEVELANEGHEEDHADRQLCGSSMKAQGLKAKNELYEEDLKGMQWMNRTASRRNHWQLLASPSKSPGTNNLDNPKVGDRHWSSHTRDATGRPTREVVRFSSSPTNLVSATFICYYQTMTAHLIRFGFSFAFSQSGRIEVR